MRVELTRFRVVPGKSSRVDEWMGMLNHRMPEALATLEREQMLVEVIFRERIGEEEFLSWFSIQEGEGEPLTTSTHAIDREHLAFWDECIDRSYGANEAVPQVVMVRAAIAHAAAWADPSRAAVGWAGQSTWHASRGDSGPTSEQSDSSHLTPQGSS